MRVLTIKNFYDMKKKTVLCVALAAFMLFACEAKKEGPVAELRTIVDEYVEKLEKANSMEEIMTLGEDMEKRMSQMEEKYPDFKPTPEEEKEVKENMEKGQKVAMEAAQRFAEDLKNRMTK